MLHQESSLPSSLVAPLQNFDLDLSRPPLGPRVRTRELRRVCDGIRRGSMLQYSGLLL